MIRFPFLGRKLCISPPLLRFMNISSSAYRVAVDHVANGILKEDSVFSSGVPNSRFSLHPDKTLQDHLNDSKNCDPLGSIQENLSKLNSSISDTITSDLPLLHRAVAHLFKSRGKQIRPAIVLLCSKALSATTEILDSQQRLAEITEMIHTASLLHDDVVDHASVRRGIDSVNSKFGNKTAILGGDFLLARASVALARLNNVSVVELLATVIEHLVKGEILQTRNSMENLELLDLYTTKTFYKTASLIANSCKAIAILGNHSELEQEIVFEYGKHLGIVFQIVDDLLDFSGSMLSLGKPALHDLSNGIASAPILFAAKELPQLSILLERRFSEPGDVDQTIALLKQSSGIQKTWELAHQHASYAVSSILQLPESESRDCLIQMVDLALSRSR